MNAMTQEEEFDELDILQELLGSDILGLKLMDRYFHLSSKMLRFVSGGGLGSWSIVGAGGGAISIAGSAGGAGGVGGVIGIGGSAGGACGASSMGSWGAGGGGSGIIHGGIIDDLHINGVTSGYTPPVITLPSAIVPGTEFTIRNVSLAPVSVAVPNIIFLGTKK